MLRQVAGLTDSKPDPMAFLDGGATEQKPPDAPEVLLVGTGLKQRLLAPQVTQPLLQLGIRSEEHTSELQSLMRNSYAVFCLKNKNKTNLITQSQQNHTKCHQK